LTGTVLISHKAE